MSALALIRQCRDAGIRLQARGDRLHVEAPPGTVTPELRQRLTECKAELLALHAIRGRLLVLAVKLGIPHAVVDTLPAEELEATAQQAALCESYRDGHGDPLTQSLLVFYLKCLANKAATASHLPE